MFLLVLILALEPSLSNMLNASALITPSSDSTEVAIPTQLENAHLTLSGLMANNTSDIPLVAEGIMNSSLMVVISEKAPQSEDYYQKELTTLVGDVPMKVELGHFDRESCSGSPTLCRPLIGGIQVEQSPTTAVGTLTAAFTDNNGVNGFVMSSHVANPAANGLVGQAIGQPDLSNLVGTVIANPTLNNRVSDSAFVQLSAGQTTTPNIYPGEFVAGTMKSSETPDGMSISKYGITTGETSGYIIGKGLTVSDPYYGTLFNQVVTNYSSSGGDSGAPVFTNDDPNNVYLLGIHVGKLFVQGDPSTTYPVYSPWEGIRQELSLRTGVTVYATEQSTGNYINGMYVTVKDSNHNVIQSGYTPLYVHITITGTYYVSFTNYGSYYFTSTPITLAGMDYNVYNWGGEVQTVFNTGDMLNVKGIYYNNNNPGVYSKVTFEGASGGTPLSMSVTADNLSGNVVTKGYTPFTVGIATNQQRTVIWNNYGGHNIYDRTTNLSEQSFVVASWGATQKVTATVSGGSQNYDDKGLYS